MENITNYSGNWSILAPKMSDFSSPCCELCEVPFEITSGFKFRFSTRDTDTPTDVCMGV